MGAKTAFFGRRTREHGEKIEGRVVLESAEAFQLREPGVSYLIDFGPKNGDIGQENGYFWNTNLEHFNVIIWPDQSARMLPRRVRDSEVALFPADGFVSLFQETFLNKSPKYRIWLT